jgi:hypothetical protein
MLQKHVSLGGESANQAARHARNLRYRRHLVTSGECPSGIGSRPPSGANHTKGYELLSNHSKCGAPSLEVEVNELDAKSYVQGCAYSCCQTEGCTV